MNFALAGPNWPIDYNFKKTRFVDENSAGDQLDHVLSECYELIHEIENNYEDMAEAVKDEKVLMEVVDKYHSIETLLRILTKERGGAFVSELFQKVLDKNKQRGYYVTP